MKFLIHVLVPVTVVIGSNVSAADLASTTKKVNVPTKVDFARDVRPILSSNCFACHGTDDKSRQAGLRLDVRTQAISVRSNGLSAISPGNLKKSSLIARITTKNSGQVMPPPSTGHSLLPSEISTLKSWIVQGAEYKDHWAFQQVKRPKIPSTKNRSWCKSSIDYFLLSEAEHKGLAPNPVADRQTLARRLSLDLIGLPPSKPALAAFIEDRSPNAYEKYVDSLLANPHFGEKWARVWLDLARYADSAGYGSDPLRPNIWPWRDWVINAFNSNMPYDRFTLEQLAGDLLPNATESQRIATAFHRNTMTNTEGGTDREEFRTAAVKDRTITTAQTWMGLTMGCAQCHNHKFDPISQSEFYKFMAYFNQTADNDQPDESPTMPIWSPGDKEKHDKLVAEVVTLKAKKATREEIAAKEKQVNAIKPVNLPIIQELPAAKFRKSHKLILGNFLQPAEEVTAELPSAFRPGKTEFEGNRLGVAKWLTSRENPLTSRVAVNRFWSQIFGKGIVETEEDFGYQGSLPTNQPLLDWLAVEFMDSGWNMKQLIKTIVMSSAYRQSSTVSKTALQVDPKNVLLMRYPRRRLDAETVRDQALAISGLLSDKIGGPSVFPPQPAGMWQAAFNGDRTYPTSTGEDKYRRGIYTFIRRTVPYPSMAAFDAPSRETSCIRRVPTNTPLQALVTLNDPVYVEMAQAFARKIVSEGGSTDIEKAIYAFERATCRKATGGQATEILALLNSERQRYGQDSTAATKMATDPIGPLPSGCSAQELAAWTVVANMLLNLDGVMTNG